ncbi:MAG TPA: DNA-deoxyinosine glycosylase [Rectinemataceae bacterium]|nr:DNA-deoxyinosine glycosylase [Rectinemataceae bacterium]
MKQKSREDERTLLLGLPPLDPKGARVLILGSFPSALSLERSEYYGHPRNQFWPIIATIASREMSVEGEAEYAVIEEPPPDWPSRMALAARLRLAIWDLVASCQRKGSLDAAIKNPILNDINGFVASRPTIDSILLNGAAAAMFFERLCLKSGGLGSAGVGEPRPVILGGRELFARRLPSTSPVPTARFRKASDKLPLWREGLLT